MKTKKAGEVDQELDQLRELHARFTQEMLNKLDEQKAKGWHGWQNPDNYDKIKTKLLANVLEKEEQEVDIANLAMFLWHLKSHHRFQ